MSGSIERGAGDSQGQSGPVLLDAEGASRASRVGWDALANDYQAEHGAALGSASLLWGPEGLREAEAGLLGPLTGRHVLEVGCGAGQGSRWAAGEGASAVGVDISWRQLQWARRLDQGLGSASALSQADAGLLPFASSSFDVAFAAHGAVAFVGDLLALHREVARVLHPRGTWVFSVTHPIRWCFPDDPGPRGLRADRAYWDDQPYVERDEAGHAVYVEHHHTIGDHVRALRSGGFALENLVEPSWDPRVTSTWGGWSPERGAVLPGTAIFVCRRP